jgi:hypothetical protein
MGSDLSAASPRWKGSTEAPAESVHYCSFFYPSLMTVPRAMTQLIFSVVSPALFFRNIKS